MSTVDEHYEQLLAKHYTWMFGVSFDERVEEQRSLLSRLLEPLQERSGLAVDLGCGPGFQTIALAQLGFSPVVAIDTSAELLEELRSHVDGPGIQIKRADLRDLPTYVPDQEANLIVCMGDTLTHLPARSDVGFLFRGIFDGLRAGGMFIITYRDLTTELHGTDRFIPVRSDENKIMTCFLECESEETVVIHDLLHIRHGANWVLNKSSYRKLRLGTDWVCQELREAGFAVVSQGPSGRLTAIATIKP